MNKIMAFLILLSISMTASASIVCTNPGITGLIFTSDESVDGHLQSIMVSGGPVKSAIVLSKVNGATLALDRHVSESAEKTVYMAADRKNLVTLSMTQPIPEGKKSAAIIDVTVNGVIVEELLYCSDDSYEGP